LFPISILHFPSLQRYFAGENEPDECKNKGENSCDGNHHHAGIRDEDKAGGTT
jgi:hypothetical protein